MKNLIGILAIAVSSTASAAQPGPTFHCSGTQNGSTVQLDFYHGYSYDATYAYFKDGGLAVSSGLAHGGSYTLCGSRTTPCDMITTTQYNVVTQYEPKRLNLIFTMISSAGSHKGKGSISIYGNGHGLPPTEQFQVTCEM
jgi:hypothetical protein